MPAAGSLDEKIEAFACLLYTHLGLHVAVQQKPLGDGHTVYVAREHLEVRAAR